MKIISAGNTNIGRKRKVNQDYFQVDQNLYVLADGMGGHAGGETASRLTVETIVQAIAADKNNVQLDPTDLLMGAIHRGNTAVHSTAEKNPALRGMGTTVVAMYVAEGKLFVGHVGDSRVYMARRGEIWQITKDHSLVNEKLKAGIITREQMKRDKSRNVITRSVGFESSVLVDLYQKDISPGEIYFSCSDGLSGLVDDLQISSIIDSLGWDTNDLNPMVDKLIEKANENGGDDNITVIAFRVDA